MHTYHIAWSTGCLAEILGIVEACAKVIQQTRTSFYANDRVSILIYLHSLFQFQDRKLG